MTLLTALRKLGTARAPAPFVVSDLIRSAATHEAQQVLESLHSAASGLTEEDAAARLEEHGPNEVARERTHGWAYRLWVAVRNPLVILLTVLATLSYATGDLRAGTVMLLMVALGLFPTLIVPWVMGGVQHVMSLLGGA